MNRQVGNVALMQKMNRLKVLNFVRRNPDVSRPNISLYTGLSLASITNVTSYLLDLGLLMESGTEKVGRVGRKSTLLRFCANAYDLICIFLTEKYINIAYTDLEGKALEKIKVETNGLSPDDIMEEVRDNVKALIKSHGRDRVLGIGVAISGLVLDDSRFVFSSRLKWKNFDIKKMLEEDTGLPVFVDNVSLLKAVYYFCARSRGTHDNMLFVDLENGIGAVQFFEGAISRATIGEIGHTTVESDGEECFCGNRGCLEAMCSPQRLLTLYKEKSGSDVENLRELDRLYKKEDPAALFAVAECGKYLGIGLANLVNLFNPSVMVINTGDFEGCPSLLKEAEAELHKRAYRSLTQRLSMKIISETEENTLLGTAFNLCDRLFDIAYPKNIVE